ncbi:MAG: ABC transporter permease [Chloroflexota bacterium]|nr:ABC transporter permease [Chloroflexota bacterium]MXZ46982.1 ABC transporter permease subunit [Chloroflexota bacterium]MXZ63584.1 ABC transporter permease subunit [Chloroflexota bacterium]
MAQAEPTPGAGAAGTIYDLGYQGYDGPRRGRRYALWSLYVLSVRNAFGIGRGALPKVMAFVLLLFAHSLAIIQLILGAVLPVDEFEFVSPEDYYGLIQFILVLFVAAIASDIVGNDRRTNTLALYFSRPIERDDYALAKIAALCSGLLALTVLPQLLMFAGNALGASDGLDWVRDNADELPRIIASGVLLCLAFGSLGVLIASYAERRAFAMISVIAIFLVSFTVVGVVVSEIDNDQMRWAIFLSPLHVVDGSTHYIFDALPAVDELSRRGEPADQVAWADFPGYVWPFALLATSVVASALVVRRYRGSV